MPEITSRTPQSLSPDHDHTTLGPSMVVKGELSGTEDLLIQGQFEGTINLQDHCLTVGPDGQVKAEIHAGRTIILGSVFGNISARERIEIGKSGQVVGDLVSPGISIEDGAYFKGKIEILRKETPLPTPATKGKEAAPPAPVAKGKGSDSAGSSISDFAAAR